MFTRALTKPDGRPRPAVVPSPPLRGDWIACAAHRQHRTLLPPQEYNPLGPTTPDAPPSCRTATTIAAVFENLSRR